MWFLFALITSFFYAVYYIANQQSKLKPEIFMIYRGFLIAFLMTPVMLFYFHVFAWQFYAIVLFQGTIVSYTEYKYFQAFHKFGAENVNSIKPLSVLIMFVLWLIIRPCMILEYIREPVRSGIIILALFTLIYAVMNYRNQKIGRKSLRFLLPVLILSSIVDMSNKIITEYNDGMLLILTFHRIALTSWIIGIINLCFNFRRIGNYKKLFDLKNIYRASFLILPIFSMITVNLAMYYAKHPAYASAIIYLSVIWVVMINKICAYLGYKSHYQTIELKWILLLLIAAITLILAAL